MFEQGSELSRHSSWSGWQPIGIHCSLPGRRGAVRWSRSTQRTTEIEQSTDRRRQRGRQIKVITLRSDRGRRQNCCETVSRQCSRIQFSGISEYRCHYWCKTVNPTRHILRLRQVEEARVEIASLLSPQVCTCQTEDMFT